MASVVLVSAVDKRYAYAIPQPLVGHLQPGQRVSVPIGRSGRLAEAFVLDISQQPWTTTLRFLDSVVEGQSWLEPHLLELGRWLSEYYASPLGRTLAAMVPAVVRRRSGFRTVRLMALAVEPQQWQTARRLSPQQRRVLQAVTEDRVAVDAQTLCHRLQVSKATLRGLVKKGWLTETLEKRPRQAPDFDEPIVEPDFILNDDQRQACDRIAEVLTAGGFEAMLLYGVSGSGKTEVYIDAMKRVLARGRQVILLVPEIALTTQMVRRFSTRFRDVAVIHSGLTGAKRSLTWHAIKSGDKRVVIGTRSAVFAPCRDLGLIVIDEEQEPSYKSLQSPRFHAREAALQRARLLRIPLLLGSATPSLETWHNCRMSEHFSALRLTRRVCGLELPEVEVVDMRYEQGSRRGHHTLSRLLEQRMGETLRSGEQIVLLLNRRGYAHMLYCPKCKNRVVCHRCRASLVFHRTSSQAICHHCHAAVPAPRQCADPSCGTRLVHLGVGTERVEEEIRQKFPSARTRRVDRDTMSRLRHYEKVVRDFEARAYDIMLGTQMVAKGFDFPLVSLVGVISADTSLVLPDFRANERTFQLVTQVAGRAGRARAGGRVVLQTSMADLPALQAAAAHDYDAFVEQELVLREETHMPPSWWLTRWVLSDRAESRLRAEAQAFTEVLKDICGHLGYTSAEINGPLPSPLERLRGQYRYDVLLKTASQQQRAAVLAELRHERRYRPRVQRWVVDVDPISLS